MWGEHPLYHTSGFPNYSHYNYPYTMWDTSSAVYLRINGCFGPLFTVHPPLRRPH